MWMVLHSLLLRSFTPSSCCVGCPTRVISFWQSWMGRVVWLVLGDEVHFSICLLSTTNLNWMLRPMQRRMSSFPMRWSWWWKVYVGVLFVIFICHNHHDHQQQKEKEKNEDLILKVLLIHDWRRCDGLGIICILHELILIRIGMKLKRDADGDTNLSPGGSVS